MQVAEGYKQTEVGVIPEDWEHEVISSVFKFKQGVQTPLGEQYTSSENRVRFIRIIDLTNHSEPPRYISSPGLSYHLEKDDLFMVRYGCPGLISHCLLYTSDAADE